MTPTQAKVLLYLLTGPKTACAVGAQIWPNRNRTGERSRLVEMASGYLGRLRKQRGWVEIVGLSPKPKQVLLWGLTTAGQTQAEAMRRDRAGRSEGAGHKY